MGNCLKSNITPDNIITTTTETYTPASRDCSLHHSFYLSAEYTYSINSVRDISNIDCTSVALK